MMTWISLAIPVAYIYSMAVLVLGSGEAFFWDLVTLIDVMLLGHWLEKHSARQASGALDALAKLLPDTAELIMSDGEVVEQPDSHLKTEDLVLVRIGASVPADGVVVDRTSDVNETMITGESQPVQKNTGDDLIAGTVNSGESSLRMQGTAAGEDTALSGIMRLVLEAQQSKSQTQLLADRAAAFLFYAALSVAVITAVAWTAIDGFSAEVMARIVTVLVIAYSHALSLAIPLVVANTTSIAARNGILVRDRQSLETSKDLDVIIFDKTGTLTNGEFGVVGVAVADSVDADTALAEAAASKGDSDGVTGHSVVYLAKDKEVAAAFALADVIRLESEMAIDELHKMGVEVAMLTVDSQEVADAVARELDIDQIIAEVLPEDKDDKVIELQAQGKEVSIAGEGVNDAPALTRADVGIAIGSGTDMAVE